MNQYSKRGPRRTTSVSQGSHDKPARRRIREGGSGSQGSQGSHDKPARRRIREGGSGSQGSQGSHDKPARRRIREGGSGSQGSQGSHDKPARRRIREGGSGSQGSQGSHDKPARRRIREGGSGSQGSQGSHDKPARRRIREGGSGSQGSQGSHDKPARRRIREGGSGSQGSQGSHDKPARRRIREGGSGSQGSQGSHDKPARRRIREGGSGSQGSQGSHDKPARRRIREGGSGSQGSQGSHDKPARRRIREGGSDSQGSQGSHDKPARRRIREGGSGSQGSQGSHDKPARRRIREGGSDSQGSQGSHDKPARRSSSPVRGRRIHPNQQLEEAVRIQKVLSNLGIGSRRIIEEWIESGQVKVNDRLAKLGQRILPSDKVKLKGRLIKIDVAKQPVKVLMYHKIEGEIVSRNDPENRPSVFDKLPRLRGGRWIAVGRLDFNTSGLLLFTNHGGLAERLMHPRYEIEREYAVRILGHLDDEQIQQLLLGVLLEDGLAKFNHIVFEGGEGANHWYKVTLLEGRNREVRRIFESLDIQVSRLMRVRFGQFFLPRSLPRGRSEEIDQIEKTLRHMGIEFKP